MLWKYTRNHLIPHMMRTLKGRFKGKNNLCWYFVLLTYQTKSGIPTRKWIIWILYRWCKLDNQEKGFLFVRDNIQKESIGYYDPMLRNLLEQGQKMWPGLLKTRLSIVYFSLIRSPRCWETTEVGKINKETVDIELINWWRKREAERDTEAGLLMWQVCTQISRAIVAAFTLLSESLGKSKGLFWIIFL